MDDLDAPVFADTALAARIERTECRLLEEAVRAVEILRPDEEVMARRIGGGLATYAGEGSPLNKVAGLGFAESPSQNELADVESVFARLGAPTQIELSTLAQPDTGAMLQECGYELQGYEHVLALPLARWRTSPAHSTIEVTPCPDAQLETWLDVVVEAFTNLDSRGASPHEVFEASSLRRAVGDMARADGVRRLSAFSEGSLVGGASMFIDGSIALMCGAGTRPAYRRRGVQGALLAARLRMARDTGCDLGVVTTLPASQSQANVQKRGFQLLYARAIWENKR